MYKEDKKLIEDFVELLNGQGRPVAEYLDFLLKDEDNEEAAAWIEVILE